MVWSNLIQFDPIWSNLILLNKNMQFSNFFDYKLNNDNKAPFRIAWAKLAVKNEREIKKFLDTYAKYNFILKL